MISILILIKNDLVLFELNVEWLDSKYEAYLALKQFEFGDRIRNLRQNKDANLNGRHYF